MDRALFYKSEGVRDCVKWIEGEIKLAKGDIGYGYSRDISTMVSIKISLEKYMKKLIHQSKEEY